MIRKFFLLPLFPLFIPFLFVPFLFVPLLFTLPTHASSARDAITLQVGARAIEFSLDELKQKLTTVQIQVPDPVYPNPRNFDAFRLEDVIALLSQPPDSADEIIFQARDGYSPSVSRAKLTGHPAYLAYQEHGRKDRFEKVRQGKALLSPAPFFLIWGDGKTIGEEYPWPYQLVRIELVSFKEKYGKIYPEGTKPDSSEMRGFTIFKTECIRCHSVNLVGGDIGPELNTPKNVLEYWNEKTLRAFIKDASSFRAKDKMPTFSPRLNDANIDDLFDYFHYLRKNRPSGPS